MNLVPGSPPRTALIRPCCPGGAVVPGYIIYVAVRAVAEYKYKTDINRF